ncbi:tetratricopeptide repeat-containing sulfotransferase family protein [Novosphingobium sp.]|uniref:tetratricopeptide repeat-containing sulfotransferase family protein n=1 Tax=Novosphingobium sp. TaxID=1874826 RepID=UPI0025F456BC|nr:tetratricopeptide repeat-containing sulfotransferase family protein [Novosphingobium sp.]MCC6924226.1 sulfotransferase [Novosphingobium sp.]
MTTETTASLASPDLAGEADKLVEAAKAALQRGSLGDAEARCNDALNLKSDHREALYVLAAVQRYAKRPVDALATIARLIDADPGYGRAYQERGHCLRALGRDAEALAAYQAAVEHNVGLLASWRMLAEMQARAGQHEAAGFARSQCAYLESLPGELQAVISLIQERRILKAENLCRAFLQQHGHHPEGMRLLAEIGVHFNSYEEAEFLLESCMVLDPGNINAQFDYVNLLHKRQKYGEALDQAKALLGKAPANGQYELLYANQAIAVGEFEEGLEIYRKQLATMPDNPTLHLSVGHALKTIGNQAEAIDAYRQAYHVRPDFGDAYWSLANLKTYRFEAGEIKRMRELEDHPRTRLADRYHLCFALGKALEDREDFADSFAYYDRGNRLKREELRYDWRRITAELERQHQHCGAELFDRFKGAGCPAPDPIFILGLPRAGSTLLEQILSSHSQVEGTLELPNILSLAHRIDGRRRVGEEANYPGNLTELTAEQLTEFGEAFLRDTQIHRKRGTPYFIDKMPNNFRHIALIRLILPNARIIDARRGAMGCCFSGFKQLFAEGQDFTYGLEEVGHYYSDYVRLMDHWDQVLPGQVLRVRYEEVVADLDGQVRRLLDFCGLPFEAACLNFHETERAVRTASSEQVRQPIFRSGVDQWEKFSEFLDPLRAVLGPELANT